MKYPNVKWENLGDNESTEEILLILIERNEWIRTNLYFSTYNLRRFRQKKAQYEELAKTLFTRIPEISIHLQTPQGLNHYTELISSRLHRFEERFLDVILQATDEDHSDTPLDPAQIEKICPSFFRLAPLIWEYISAKRGDFKNPLISKAINRSNLNFCTAITLYDPNRPAAQIAAQDAILRRGTIPTHELGNQPRSNYHQGATAAFVAFERINNSISAKEEAGQGTASSKRNQEDPDYEPPLPKRQRRLRHHQRLASAEPDPQPPGIIRHLRSGPVYRGTKISR